uniref:Uncharacterized protein n=1 Tax=Sphaerodactylus townsendi TaxID=933632 RepID=A0ACB8GA77_9SAUR
MKLLNILRYFTVRKDIGVAERNRAASKVPKLGKPAAACGKSVKKISWMKEPAHQPKEQCQSRGSLRGAPAVRMKVAHANGAHSDAGLCGTMDHLTAGAQEKGTSGTAQSTDTAHGSGGPHRGLPSAELPNAPLTSSTRPSSPSGAAAALRGPSQGLARCRASQCSPGLLYLAPLQRLAPCATSVNYAAPNVPFFWAGHIRYPAREKGTSGAAQSTDAVHGGGGPQRRGEPVRGGQGSIGKLGTGQAPEVAPKGQRRPLKGRRPG